MKVEYRLTTLTPIWTGGIKIEVDRVHETGIIGSLRWWFEVFVRGMGGDVCDPVQHKCKFDAEKYKKAKAENKPNHICLREAGICDVCQVFGATGWRRRFRLTIVDQTQPDTRFPRQISADRPVNPHNKKAPTWYFFSKPRFGNLICRIQSLDQEFPPEIIGGMLQFIADWTAIGAKVQMGFGVIKLEDDNVRIDTQPLYNWLISKAGRGKYDQLPSLQNLFLARIQSEKIGEKEIFNLKYDLRRLFADNTDLRHFIMGTVKRDRMAAKLKISHLYSDNLIRVWGWIPDKADVYQDSWNREVVVDAIYQHLSKHYSLQVWRELNSSRDTVTPNNTDVQAFLQSILGLKEGG